MRRVTLPELVAAALTGLLAGPCRGTDRSIGWQERLAWDALTIAKATMRELEKEDTT